MPCPICDNVPEIVTGEQVYRLWAPLGHSEKKLERALREAGATVERLTADSAIGFIAPANVARGILEAAVNALTVVERRDTMMLETPVGQPGNAAHLREVRSIDRFLARWGAGWLMRHLEGGIFPVSLERIAFADEIEETFGYFALYHGRDDQDVMVPCSDVIEIAKRAGLLAPVDRAGRISAIQGAAEVGEAHPVFIPFSPATIYDPEFCLRTSIEAAEEVGMASDSLVFTILAPEPDDDFGHLESILDFYRRNGFQAALAGVGSGMTAVDLVPTLRPDFLFLDEELTARAPSDPLYAIITRKLLEIAHRLDVETVIGGVATAEHANWAFENGANYVAGPMVDAQPVAVGAA